jgi:hypothetical protein
MEVTGKLDTAVSGTVWKWGRRFPARQKEERRFLKREVGHVGAQRSDWYRRKPITERRLRGSTQVDQVVTEPGGRHPGIEGRKGRKGLKRTAGRGEQETSKANIESRGVGGFFRLVASPEPELDRTERDASLIP